MALKIRFLLVGTFFGDVSSDFALGRVSPSNDVRDNFYVKKVFYPNDHGLSLGMVYRTACRYEYDVTYMIMTSLTSAARFLLRPTVALVDRDYQFYTRRYLSSSKMMMKCLFQSQYMYRSYEVLFNFDLYEARFEALLGEIWFFRPFLAYMASWMAF